MMYEGKCLTEFMIYVIMWFLALNLNFMLYQGPERRDQPDEAQGLVELAVRRKIPIDQLPLQRAMDVKRQVELRDGARKKLLAIIASPAPEQTNPELHPVAGGKTTTVELSLEQKWFDVFKTRFDSFPHLHEGVQWSDVEKTLKADRKAMGKLQLLDEAGFEMNVFGEKNGEIIFRTAQTDVTKIASKYRTIMADKKAQIDYPQYSVHGNAEEIAAFLGVEVADSDLYKQYRVQNGWVWLKTDEATRKTGTAFFGNRDGIYGYSADFLIASGSFCAALRVKKA